MLTYQTATGVTGHLINARNGEYYCFRVYGETEPETGRRPFVDYEICGDDILITITDPRSALVRRGEWAGLLDCPTPDQRREMLGGR